MGGSCIRGDDLKNAAIASSGWHWDGEPKPGWASSSGGELTVHLHLPPTHPKAWVGFVRSHSSSMGKADARCIGECQCSKTFIAHDPSSQATVTVTEPINVVLPSTPAGSQVVEDILEGQRKPGQKIPLKGVECKVAFT